MKKVAVFVEGQTEQIFVRKLAVTGIMPEGYVTGEKFWADEKNHTKQFCLENGIL
jgi:hypothetical protein